MHTMGDIIVPFSIIYSTTNTQYLLSSDKAYYPCFDKLNPLAGHNSANKALLGSVVSQQFFCKQL